jgi:group I intron endonuclease
MKHYIYKIVNPQGEVYIGRTKNIEKRIDLYSRYSTLPPQPKLWESFSNYGFNNHQIEVIDYTEDLDSEAQYIKKFNSYENGLNSNKGGGGPEFHNGKTREKISKAGLKNVGNRAISHWKGKTRSEKSKQKMSQSKKGKPLLANNKPILQFDKQGNFIQEHPSIEKAAKAVKGNPTAINNALRKGGGATSSSYIWEYKN